MFSYVLFFISKFFSSGFDIFKQTRSDNNERSGKDNMEKNNENYLEYLIEPSTSFEVDSISSEKEYKYNEYK